ncbi:thiamine-phosphate kinase [Paramagnetospirillum kuznetsovii]|uniref:Thiamine-monophosphate kinase n=1 Tax=Paramagnetospirillum kuznetsovii TaxID=2053833 RepID=A0A364P070_9PROT|nr:thiamine-phosphate kinase [Paramagnetospirillum kuznetsovii]RAU22515.1 thiamine-phosphate kinase [Paramagnetospirillum kuznetsovii]
MVGTALDEFALIAELFAPLAAGCPGALGLTDDAAFLAAAPGFDTVVTMDAMVEGVHFLPDDPPDLIARKLVRVNLSDLAAKGAKPVHVMLAAAFVAGTSEDWLRRFAQGLRQDLEEYGVALIGGDTVSTPGPLSLTLTAFGRVEAGRGILRSGAKVGHDVWLSGSLGDAALGLKAIRGQLSGVDEGHLSFLAGRYRLPSPRLRLGQGLVGLAASGMDVSDGLVQDLGHICRASGVGAEIEAARLPLSRAAAQAIAGNQSLLALALEGGDDYELLFTADPALAESLRRLATATATPLTPIGRIVSAESVTAVRVLGADGRPVPTGRGGWRHF